MVVLCWINLICRERAEALIEPLTNEVVNSKLCGHEKRCVPHLADALYHIADAHPDVFQEILEKLLLKTRSNRAKVRRFRVAARSFSADRSCAFRFVIALC